MFKLKFMWQRFEKSVQSQLKFFYFCVVSESGNHGILKFIKVPSNSNVFVSLANFSVSHEVVQTLVLDLRAKRIQYMGHKRSKYLTLVLDLRAKRILYNILWDIEGQNIFCVTKHGFLLLRGSYEKY